MLPVNNNSNSSCYKAGLIGLNILFLAATIGAIALAILKGGTSWCYGVGAILTLALSIGCTVWKLKLISQAAQEEKKINQSIVTLLSLGDWTKKNSSRRMTVAHTRLNELFGIASHKTAGLPWLPKELILKIFSHLNSMGDRIHFASISRYLFCLYSPQRALPEYIKSHFDQIRAQYNQQSWWLDREKDIKEFIALYLQHCQIQDAKFNTSPAQLLNVIQIGPEAEKIRQ